MSHDTDKLIRQLSLVAFLMAELRPLTARDIKGNVEGYQEMSDEAFARRFYSDRAELVGLGVPLDSQRDEHTGEELYTLRSERYFLPPLELGDDQGDKQVKSFRVSRIRSEIRFATRRERDFRIPATFDVEDFRGRAEWQFGETVGQARIELAPDTAWWARRAYGKPRNRVDGDVFVTEYAQLPLLARWVLRQDGRAVPLDPPELRRLVLEGAKAAKQAHTGVPPEPAAEVRKRWNDGGGERPTGPVAPERFGVLQSLLAYLLTACGEEKEAVIPAADLAERFSIPPEALEEHLSLLNLVNFGGGCYAVYAELHGDEVHVDKELFGDTFRRPPRLTPLEARAIRLALEFVGPMIAAGAHSPLDRVRAKLEETFGAFALAQPSTAPRSPSAQSAAPSGSSARCSRFAAPPSCSSRSSCASRCPRGRQSCRRSSARPLPSENLLPARLLCDWKSQCEGRAQPRGRR